MIRNERRWSGRSYYDWWVSLDIDGQIESLRRWNIALDEQFRELTDKDVFKEVA